MSHNVPKGFETYIYMLRCYRHHFSVALYSYLSATIHAKVICWTACLNKIFFVSLGNPKKEPYILLLLPLALQPAVGFGLSNNTSPFFPIYYQLSPSSHSQHSKISFYFFCPFFPGSSSSSRPFQFLSEDLFGHPILLHSLQVTQPTYPLPLYPF